MQAGAGQYLAVFAVHFSLMTNELQRSDIGLLIIGLFNRCRQYVFTAKISI